MPHTTRALHTRFLRRILAPIDRYCHSLFHAEHEASLRERIFAQIKESDPWQHIPREQMCPEHQVQMCRETVTFALTRHKVEGWVCPFWDLHVIVPPVFPDVEAHTDPMHTLATQRPLDVFIQQRQAGAGVHTAMTRAIPKPEK